MAARAGQDAAHRRETLETSREPLLLAERRVVVLGLARSGCAAAELLHAHGARVVGVDEGPGVLERLPGDWAARTLDAAYATAGPQALDGAELVVLSPGVPTAHPLVRAARARGIPVVAEIELAWRTSVQPVIAVTGSKGKSTTVALIGHLLAGLGVPCVVAGNIGLPYSAVAGQLGTEDWVVLEVSSFQLETVDRFHARAAVQLAISPDHLDRYADMKAYAAAKARIARHQTSADLLVVAASDPYGERLAARAAARVVGFDGSWRGTGVLREGEEIVWRAGGERVVLARAGDVPLLGAHNVANAMAALAVAYGMGFWNERGRAALSSFAALEYRMQPCGEIDGIRIVNDAKSTTVESVRAAVRGLPGPLLLALGGRNKELDFRPLRDDLGGVRAVFVFGESAPKIAGDLGDSVPLERVRDLDELLERVMTRGRPGDTFVFSPGCTSFDMFRNAEHRGAEFEAAVERARRARRT